MIYSTILLFSVICFAYSTQGQVLTPCTTCWCDNTTIAGGKCPDIGIRQAFPPGYSDKIIEEFSSLTLVGKSPSFDPPFCQPFPTVAALPLPNQVQGPACVGPLPNETPKTVCAFKYLSCGTCKNRKYKLKTFASEAKARCKGWIPTHTGGK